MDGPQAEQLELGPYGQILQDEDKSKREEKLRPAQIREKETTCFSTSKRTSDSYMDRKHSWRSKGRGHHPTVSDANYLSAGLLLDSYLG